MQDITSLDSAKAEDRKNFYSSKSTSNCIALDATLNLRVILQINLDSIIGGFREISRGRNRNEERPCDMYSELFLGHFTI